MSTVRDFSHISQTFAKWHRRWRSRRELTKLQAIELSDFGCTKVDASIEASKWFWQP